MINNFGNQLTEDFFFDRSKGLTRGFAPELRRLIQRKLQYVNAAVKLQDLASPPGNRLEALKGNLKGFHSIRINDQWRIIFQWIDNGAIKVQIIDYHK